MNIKDLFKLLSQTGKANGLAKNATITITQKDRITEKQAKAKSGSKDISSTPKEQETIASVSNKSCHFVYRNM